ncbi:hypothetical protein [Olleya sp. Bg11-27]|uniref:hypothetical protein n=1 Tax=Olleya sp. Bg11-27 TaxID=2058135 RepID=UPI000C31045E|nr:hypothetical protein [Olleya sp. Bg11-27]AUC76211.1 hypothetical protein CW732_11255 [Olleya sp. Bg11-27]
MGTITLRDYPNEILQFELPEVESDIIRIHIHMVRIYNDGTTILSVIKMTIGGDNYYYTSVSNDEVHASPARAGSYQGYLIRRSDNEGSNHVADSQPTKQRIENIFKKLNVFDERLPVEFQNGKENYNYGKHNGLRIFDSNVKGGPTKSGGYILKGGSRFFHVGKFYFHSHGCESLGESIEYDFKATSEDGKKGLFGIEETTSAVANFLDNIIKVYEENVEKEQQSTIHIDIEVEDNIQENLSKTEKIKPEELYTNLYPPPIKE